MGTLADVFTGAILSRGNRGQKTEQVICQYCLQVRGRRHELDSAHLTKCRLNKHSRLAMMEEAREIALQAWEPEWNTEHQKDDNLQKIAYELIRKTRTKYHKRRYRYGTPEQTNGPRLFNNTRSTI